MISAKEARELTQKKKELRVERIRGICADILVQLDKRIRDCIDVGANYTYFQQETREGLNINDYYILNDMLLNNLRLLGYTICNETTDIVNKKFTIKW